MPNRRSSPCLKTLCLKSISCHIDNIWCSGLDFLLENVARPLYIIGPFDHLTGDLTQELIQVLSEDKKVQRRHFQFLIHEGLKEVNLTVAKSVANNDSVVQLLGSRCRLLTKLELSGLNQVSPMTLIEVIENMPRLSSVILRQTKTNDRVLAAIADACENLRELDIFACPVSDKGAAGFCDKWQQKSTAKLSKLKKFDISGTKISVRGACQILLTFTNLEVFNFADVCAVLDSLSSGYSEQRLSIQSLSSSCIKCMDLSAKAVEISCRMCPFVTQIHLFAGVDDGKIASLNSLKHLRVLEIANVDREHVTFETGILPLIMDIGSQLLKVSLYEINNIDLVLIGNFCCNLKSFSCVLSQFNEVVFTSTHEMPNRAAFHELRELNFVLSSEIGDLPQDKLKLILENGKLLKDVSLLNIQSLTSELLQYVTQKHKFQELMTLTLESCNQITDSGIWDLVSSNNCLKNLVLKDCFQITRQDFEKYQYFTQDNNFDLDITWQ
ncbi:hypothetical protein ScPMuIL_000549 [Solemya velum]